MLIYALVKQRKSLVAVITEKNSILVSSAVQRRNMEPKIDPHMKMNSVTRGESQVGLTSNDPVDNNPSGNLLIAHSHSTSYSIE
jgi:hypothetical protein